MFFEVYFSLNHKAVILYTFVGTNTTPSRQFGFIDLFTSRTRTSEITFHPHVTDKALILKEAINRRNW